jgi:hypothetical protein
MRQVRNIADVEGRASVERSDSPQTHHSRATGARSRGIKFPISVNENVNVVDDPAYAEIAVMLDEKMDAGWKGARPKGS